MGPTILLADVGEHIAQTAKRMTAEATRTGHRILCTFNEISLIAFPGATAAEIETNYNDQNERRHREYLASPEGIAEERRNQAEIEAAQEKVAELMAELSKLNYMDCEAVLDWFCDLQPASDRSGVTVPNAEICEAFRAVGYQSNCNLGKDFDENDPENFGRYIIGQCLAMLENPPFAIHHVLLNFADKWKAKFV